MMGAQRRRLYTNSDCLDHDDVVRTTTGNLPLQLDPSRAENYYIHHTALSLPFYQGCSTTNSFKARFSLSTVLNLR
jgi:hypothetical protein